MVHYGFPAVALGSIYIITWLFYDAVTAKRTTDEALANLRSRSSGCYATLTIDGKIEFRRRVRAIQPVRLTVGAFTVMTLGVAYSMIEEIFNQLLFLLSL